MNWEPYFDRTPSEVWFDLVSTSQICRNYWIMKIFIKRHATLVIMFFSQLSYGLCIYWVEIDVAFKQCVIRIFLSSWPSSLFDCTNRVGKKYNSTNVKGKSLINFVASLETNVCGMARELIQIGFFIFYLLPTRDTWWPYFKRWGGWWPIKAHLPLSMFLYHSKKKKRKILFTLQRIIFHWLCNVVFFFFFFLLPTMV